MFLNFLCIANFSLYPSCTVFHCIVIVSYKVSSIHATLQWVQYCKSCYKEEIMGSSDLMARMFSTQNGTMPNFSMSIGVCTCMTRLHTSLMFITTLSKRMIWRSNQSILDVPYSANILSNFTVEIQLKEGKRICLQVRE